jgi:PleD family two-component response regulator
MTRTVSAAILPAQQPAAAVAASIGPAAGAHSSSTPVLGERARGVSPGRSARSTQRSPSPHRTSLNVVLVEDNAINRRVAVTMLTRLGHVVSCAENGQDGVQLVRQKKPDAVLMDCHMPVMARLLQCVLVRSDTDSQHNRMALPPRGPFAHWRPQKAPAAHRSSP